MNHAGPTYQPHYLAYCRACGRAPDEQMAHDAREYPGGVMTGFILWISERKRSFRAAHPECFLHGGIQDAAAWRLWLEQSAPRNQTGPTRSGVVVIFFLLWCAAMLGGTLLGMRTPRTVEQVEQRWHGPAHEHPADYARDYAGRR